jgi:hypothetical protein
MAKLRSIENSQPKNHHLCTFRSGIALGLALPAFVSGVYQSMFTFLILWALRSESPSWSEGFQPERRAQIPQWDALLFIYSTFLIPVLFSLLVGINMWIWSNSRINYVFIFGPCAMRLLLDMLTGKYRARSANAAGPL